MTIGAREGVAGSRKLPYRFLSWGSRGHQPHGTHIHQPRISNAIHVMRYIHVIRQRQECLATSADSTSMTMDQTEPTLPRPGHDEREPMTAHNLLRHRSSLASCTLTSTRALSAGGFGHWANPSRPPKGMHHDPRCLERLGHNTCPVFSPRAR